MALGHQLGCGGCLGAFAMLDLGVRGSVRNVDLDSTRYSTTASASGRPPAEGGDDPLAAIDVASLARESGVRRDVNGERGDVGWPDDALDRECGAQSTAALFQLVDALSQRSWLASE
jgi:hypothetical protein